jgi:hypothetical protein
MAGTAHHYCVGVVGGVLTLLPRGRYKLEYNGQARHVIVMENLFHGRRIDTICAIAQLTTPRPAQLTTPRRGWLVSCGHRLCGADDLKGKSQGKKATAGVLSDQNFRSARICPTPTALLGRSGCRPLGTSTQSRTWRVVAWVLSARGGDAGAQGGLWRGAAAAVGHVQRDAAHLAEDGHGLADQVQRDGRNS